jgi:hypothetical protein
MGLTAQAEGSQPGASDSAWVDRIAGIEVKTSQRDDPAHIMSSWAIPLAANGAAAGDGVGEDEGANGSCRERRKQPA